MTLTCPYCEHENFYYDWGLSDFYVDHICQGCGKTIPSLMGGSLTNEGRSDNRAQS